MSGLQPCPNCRSVLITFAHSGSCCYEWRTEGMHGTSGKLAAEGLSTTVHAAEWLKARVRPLDGVLFAVGVLEVL
jgi:hypothetical protein